MERQGDSASLVSPAHHSSSTLRCGFLAGGGYGWWNGWWFASYGCWKLDRFAELKFWANYTFRDKSEFCWNFALTSQETLNTKIAVNKLNFLLVTHAAYSNAQFHSYRILKSGQGAENFLDKLIIHAKWSGFKAQDAWFLVRVVYGLPRPLTQLSNAYSYAHF
jgi:hypothetical protein